MPFRIFVAYKYIFVSIFIFYFNLEQKLWISIP